MKRNYIIISSGEILYSEDIGENLNIKPNKSLIEILAITNNLYFYEVGTEVVFK